MWVFQFSYIAVLREQNHLKNLLFTLVLTKCTNNAKATKSFSLEIPNSANCRILKILYLNTDFFLVVDEQSYYFSFC